MNKNMVTISAKNTSNTNENTINSTNLNMLAKKALLFAIELIKNGNRVIISAEDENLLNCFLNEQNEIDFLINIANFNANKYVSSQNIINNKKAENYTDNFDKYTHVKNHIYKSFIYDKLTTQNKILSADLIGSMQYHEIQELITNLEKSLKNIIPLMSADNNFTFQLDELISIENSLKNISNIYQFSFDHNLELKNLNIQKWRENEMELISKVEEYLTEFKQIIEEYYIMSTIQMNNLRKSKNEEIEAKQVVLDDLMLSLKIIKNLPVFSKKNGLLNNVFKNDDSIDFRQLASNLLREKLTEINNKGWVEIDFKQKNFDVISIAEKTITSLTLLIKYETKELDRSITNAFKSQNSLNVNNNLILLWSDSIKSLVEKLNQDQIFNKEISINTFSISKKKDEVEKVLNRLMVLREELAINRLFFEYKNLLLDCSPNLLSIIDQIKKIDKLNWNDAFQLYYFKCLIQHFNLLQPNQFKNLIEEFYCLTVDSEKFNNQLFYNNLISSCKSGLDSIKQKDKSFYKKLTNESYQNQIRYEDVLTSFPDIAWQIFPIIIKKEFDDFYFNNKIDHIIYLGRPTRKSTINHTVFNKIENQNDDNIIDYSVLDNKINLENLSITQRLVFSRNMAQILETFDSNMRFFQLKNANIITVIPDSWNDQIISKLIKFGIKEFKMESNKKDKNNLMLVESLMVTDRQQYFICKDQFINALNDDYFHQIKVLKCFKNSGITSISLNTLSIENDINQLVDSITKDNFSLIGSDSNRLIEPVDTVDKD